MPAGRRPALWDIESRPSAPAKGAGVPDGDGREVDALAPGASQARGCRVEAGAAPQVEDARSLPDGAQPGEGKRTFVDRRRAPAGPVVLLREMLGQHPAAEGRIVPRQVVVLRPGRRRDASIQDGGQREVRHAAPALFRRSRAGPLRRRSRVVTLRAPRTPRRSGPRRRAPPASAPAADASGEAMYASARARSSTRSRKNTTSGASTERQTCSTVIPAAVPAAACASKTLFHRSASCTRLRTSIIIRRSPCGGQHGGVCIILPGILRVRTTNVGFGDRDRRGARPGGE